MDIELCIFKGFYGDDCNKTTTLSENRDRKRIESIILASKKREDTLHESLSGLLENNPNLKIKYHSNCVNKYCSTKRIKTPRPLPPKRRSSEPAFNYKSLCLFCGLECNVKNDNRHPERWRKAFLFGKIEYYCSVRKKNIKYKEYLEEVCTKRDDEWGELVSLRLSGIPNDVVASDGRYHVDCKRNFCLRIAAIEHEIEDSSFLEVVRAIKADKSRIWNSVELFNLYKREGENKVESRTFISNLLKHFDGSLVPFHANGYATLLCMKDHASGVLKMEREHDSNYDKVHSLGRAIFAESKDLEVNKNIYNLDITLESAYKSMSETLKNVLENVSDKFKNSLFSVLIGNIVTSVVKNCTTPLQIALGILFRHSKKIVDHLWDYRVTCSYDEVLRFKKSAAVHSAKGTHLQGIPLENSNLVQVISDNFDSDMSSQNNSLLCHCLATIVTKNGIAEPLISTFPRLKKNEVSLPIIEDNEVEIQVYYGPKKPPMPQVPQNNLPQEFVTKQSISEQRAQKIDFNFFRDMINNKNCPEYNGYCTRLNREQGHAIRCSTSIIYLPLLDMTPANPTTMQTSMVQAKRLSTQHGQNFCVYTCDQQLYHIALAVLWNNPELAKDFYLRLGGMHFLMSYIGCIGKLMAGSGLDSILEKAFGSVNKMLTGKKFPQCIRALRLLVEELLRPILKDDLIDSHSKLLVFLNQKSSESRTCKLWVDAVIKPVFLCLMYIRGERESDYPLHLDCVEKMIPLFFAADHTHYARDGLIYLKSMKGLPENVRKHFLDGEHTVQHKPGVFSGIWTDMAIETSYMRFGHSSTSGLVGQAMKPETMKTWAYSLNSCCKVVESLEAMRNRESSESHVHKEEFSSRIKNDEIDRAKLREKLEISTDIFETSTHPKNALLNIVSGKVISEPSVNVDECLQLGEKKLKEFETKLPSGYYDTIQRTVKSMLDVQKGVRIGDKKVLDPEAIYARAIALKCIDSDFDFESLLSFELAPYPTSIFEGEGLLRTCKQKSKLMNVLKVNVSTRLNASDPNAIFIDGCAILYTISWPDKGTVEDFVNNVIHYITEKAKYCDIYLVFDRYLSDSIKGLTRMYRDNGASRVYKLSPEMSLPSREVILKVTENKIQLIQLIIDAFVTNASRLSCKNRIIVTGENPIPFEISNGRIFNCHHLKTSQEEADTILIHQLSVVNPHKAIVLSDDTDVFVLLIHFLHTGDITGQVYMQSTSHDPNTVIDINGTYEEHIDVAPNILAAHALSGCDTVGAYFGIGKSTVVKALKNSLSLDSIGNLKTSFHDSIRDATKFLLTCYGQTKSDTLTDARKRAWKSKVIRNNSVAPKLESLPPTEEAFEENVKRAHLQAGIWRNALRENPPSINVLNFGWEKDMSSSLLLPSTVKKGVNLIPDCIAKIMKCGCTSEHSCKGSHCSCHKSGLSCSTFCVCEAGIKCCNPWSTKQSDDKSLND